MTMLMASKPAPAWLHDLAAARARYEELLGWPVSVQVGQRQLVTAMGQVVDAVSMPAALGRQVAGELRIALLDGPVMAGPDEESWTFFTQPVAAIRDAIAEDLASSGVVLPPRGGYAVIPTSITESAEGTWRWVRKPEPHRPLPPWFAAIAVTRRVIARQDTAGAANTDRAASTVCQEGAAVSGGLAIAG